MSRPISRPGNSQSQPSGSRSHQSTSEVPGGTTGHDNRPVNPSANAQEYIGRVPSPDLEDYGVNNQKQVTQGQPTFVPREDYTPINDARLRQIPPGPDQGIADPGPGQGIAGPGPGEEIADTREPAARTRPPEPGVSISPPSHGRP